MNENELAEEMHKRRVIAGMLVGAGIAITIHLQKRKIKKLEQDLRIKEAVAKTWENQFNMATLCIPTDHMPRLIELQKFDREFNRIILNAEK